MVFKIVRGECGRSLCTTVHLVIEQCTSTTSMDRDITTTAVSKLDTRRLGLRNDTSCHRRRHEGQYINQQLAWTHTTTSSTTGATTSYVRPSATSARTSTSSRTTRRAKARKERKGKKGKGKGYNNNYYNYN